jgi:hypothetical protein
MIPDYLVIALMLIIVSTLLAHWDIYALCTFTLWAVFAIRIRKVHILQLVDLMPGEEDTQA